MPVMKAKLGNKIVDTWKISYQKPVDEPWVIDNFEKGRIFWGGKLLEKHRTENLVFEKEDVNRVEDDWEWISKNVDSFQLPYDIYLSVTQSVYSLKGQIGEYLVISPTGALVIYSEKEFQKLLTSD